ncbi:MAG TPA: aminotransferase class IV [Anaerolineales bacterium]|nr:aminotransferase class IV [Anaerolineales bacterium]
MSRSIYTYRFSRAGVEELYFDLQDLDSITVELPSGVYTTFRTYAGRTKVIGLHAHLDRLYLPAKAEGVRVALDQYALRRRLAGTLEPLGPHEARVRLILNLSREPGEIYVLLQPLQDLPQEMYERGVHVELSQVRREKPSLKQTAFIAQSSGERRRIRGETYEILLIRNSRVLEGMTSNFFYVRDGTLCTAGRGALSGVTRQAVLEVAKRAKLPIRSKALHMSEIPNIDEAFITSSSRGIIPVVKIGEQQVGLGNVGAITKLLMDLYDERVSALAEPIL